MKKRHGFTLIELIIVLVIVGIIAGVTIPRYVGSLESVNFKKTMSALVCFLREGRIKAMSSASTKKVMLDLHRGLYLNDEKKIFRLPVDIVIFTDKEEAREEKTRILTFFPNGSAKEERLGFVCNKLTAVLSIEPLSGMAYFKMNEKMEEAVRYSRTEEPLSDEEIEKMVDKLKDSDTVTFRDKKEKDARKSGDEADIEEKNLYFSMEDDEDATGEDDNEDEEDDTE